MELNAIFTAAPQTRPPYQKHAGSGSARPGTESATRKSCFCQSPDPGLRTTKQAPLQQNDSGEGKQHKKNLISSQQIPSTYFRGGWWGWDLLEYMGDHTGSIFLKAQILLRSDPFLHPSGINLGCFTGKSKRVSSFSLL